MYEERTPLEVWIMTRQNQICGQLYFPPGQSAATHFNITLGELLRITDPKIYGFNLVYPPRGEDLKMSAGFLALHQTQVLWLVGGQEDDHPSWENQVGRRMAFLFDTYILVGNLVLSPSQRSSDYLKTAKPFQTLRDVALYNWQPKQGRFLILGKQVQTLFEVSYQPSEATPVTELEPLATFAFITINLSQTLGVLEAPEIKRDQPRYAIVK
jgi:hypothetical protein